MCFKKVKKKLEENGWQVVRISGSHVQFKHATRKDTGTICVPCHGGNRDISIGVIKSLERATGLSFRG